MRKMEILKYREYWKKWTEEKICVKERERERERWERERDKGNVL